MYSLTMKSLAEFRCMYSIIIISTPEARLNNKSGSYLITRNTCTLSQNSIPFPESKLP